MPPLAALGGILAGGAGVSAAATTGAWTAIGAGGLAAGQLIGAHEQTNAAENAANIQAQAAKYAADVQSQTAAKALDFQQQQAALDRQTAEINRQANYAQWVASQQRINPLAAAVGLPSRPIPAYVPMPSSGAPSPVSTTAGISSGNSGLPQIDSSKDLGSQISAYFKSQGVSDQETPYWVAKWPELVARGQELNDPNYAVKRLSQANVFGGGATAPATSSTSGSPLVPGAGYLTSSAYNPGIAPGVTPYVSPMSNYLSPYFR